MAQNPGWYFGGKNPWEGSAQQPGGQFGGFNLGGVQTPFSAPTSTVASPSPAAGVSGSAPGQPAPQGGMSVGSEPGGSTPSTSTPDSNANVTGLNGDLAGTFGTVATMGLPGLGAVTGPAAAAAGGPLAGVIGSLVGSVAQSMGIKGLANAAANHSDGLVDGKGNPVVYTGNNNIFGLPLGSLHAVDNPNDPDMASTISDVPSVSPNMGLFSGPADMGFPSTYSGLATGVGTGNPSPNSTNFGGTAGRGNTGDPDGPAAPAGPVGTVGTPGDGPGGVGDGSAGTGDGSGAGAGPAGTGAGGASGTGGDGGVGSGPGDKRGGRVGRQRPDPRKLSDMLKAGDKVQAGSKKPGADDVPVRLSRGEEVVNKNATDQFGPILDKMNKMGNRQGGFSIGRQAGR
jgi:hypothetical protein